MFTPANATIFCNTREHAVPVILGLEELEFLLDAVQSFQDGELERLAGLQGDLDGRERTDVKTG